MLFLTSLVSFFLSYQVATASQSCGIADSAKVDCGYAGIDQSACESKG
jgi:hypothetical protein